MLRNMKVIQEKPPQEMTTITVRMPKDLKAKIDKARGKVPREAFIRAVLEQVIADPKFVLRVK